VVLVGGGVREAAGGKVSGGRLPAEWVGFVDGGLWDLDVGGKALGVRCGYVGDGEPSSLAEDAAADRLHLGEAPGGAFLKDYVIWCLVHRAFASVLRVGFCNAY